LNQYPGELGVKYQSNLKSCSCIGHIWWYGYLAFMLSDR